MLGRAPEILFKYPRKIQRLGKTADISYLGYVLLYVAGGAKELFRHLHAQSGKVIVRGHSHLALKQLSQVVVAERYRPEVLVQLVVAVGAVLHDVALDSPHHISEGLGALKGDNVVYYQISEGLYDELIAVRFTVEIIEGIVEGRQDMLVAVVGNQHGAFERKGSVPDVDMYVRKALVAVVRMGYSRRDNNYVSELVAERAIVKNKLTAAAGAVDQLPAFVGVAVHGKGYKVLSDIYYIIHCSPVL